MQPTGITMKWYDISREKTLHKLIESIKHSSCDGVIDYQWLHEIGCTCDDTELPHHVSSTDEIQHLLHAVNMLLKALPTPKIITIARYIIIWSIIRHIYQNSFHWANNSIDNLLFHYIRITCFVKSPLWLILDRWVMGHIPAAVCRNWA